MTWTGYTFLETKMQNPQPFRVTLKPYMKRAALLSLAVVCILAVSCGRGNFSERASQGKANTFVYPIVTNPTTLDPQIVQDGDTIDLIQNVYEGLVAWGEDNTPKPALAESWDIKDGGTTYVFHIRPGCKFHNGEEVTADSFKYAIERACNPKLASPTAEDYLSDIVGASDRIDAEHTGAKEVTGVKAVDKLTLEIKIDKPRPYFLDKLTYPITYAVPRDVAPFDHEMRDLKEMVGAGPYKLTDYQKDQITVMEAFADYHGGKPKIDKIERPVITDATTRLNKFKSGEIDLVPLERRDVNALQADAQWKDQLHFYPRPAFWYIGLNQKEYPPFANRNVRRAVAMAINKHHIVKDLLGGINEEANSIVPPGVEGWPRQAAVIPYNPDEAKKLLASAGYPGGKGLPPLDIYYRVDRPDIELVASEVALELQQTLGMKVSQQALEWRNYLDKNNHNLLPFFHMRWAADYLDPQDFLSLLLASYGPENHVNYKNAQYDALCAKADISQDPEERKKLYDQAEDIALQDAPYVPIYFQKDAELINPRVLGLRVSLFGHLPHTTVSLSK
jgi:ABC-type transport system substrate-binding protein